MNALYWLAAANAALWLGLGLYAAYLAGKQKDIERRISRMEAAHE